MSLLSLQTRTDISKECPEHRQMPSLKFLSLGAVVFFKKTRKALFTFSTNMILHISIDNLFEKEVSDICLAITPSIPSLS